VQDMILTHLRTAVPFAAHVGVELVSIGDGEGSALLPALDHALNHVGTQHAGALFTLGEAASGIAMAGAFAPVLLSVRPVAAAAHTAYLAPARGPITAHARVDGAPGALRDTLASDGKVRFRVDVTLRDQAGVDVATMQVYWHVSRNRAAA
jgi:acyl-coenzyme A thioesterase PaaI-like protein